MLNVGVIGLGVISSVHIKAIQSNPKVQLVATCDIDSSKKETVPDSHFYRNAEDMLKQEKLDVVHICLPHYLHVPMALLANHYHCHVLTEKPVGISTTDASRLLHPDDPGKIIAVCFQNRFNETTIALQNILAQHNEEVRGAKGLVMWNRGAQYYQNSPWRGKKAEAGYGSTINQAIHIIDLIQLFCGEYISCRGVMANLSGLPIEVEDTASANLQFKNDVTAYFNSTNTFLQNDSTELEIITTKNKYLIKDGGLFQYSQNGSQIKIANDEKIKGIKSYYGSSHSRLIDDFYTSILTNSERYIPVSEAIKSVHIIDEIYESSGRKVIQGIEISRIIP